MSKDFRCNPTEAFFRPAYTPSFDEEDMSQYPKEIREEEPVKIESKSKRVQLLVKPSLYDRMKAEAEAEGISLNELYGRAARDYLRGVERRKRKAQEENEA